MERLISLLIGYLLGNILTGEIVARIVAKKSASEIGTTGNPGMANIMAHLGFKPGIAVLAGDLLKVIAAVALSRVVCGKLLPAGILLPGGVSISVPGAGNGAQDALLAARTAGLATLYAGFGCTLGHDFPFWRRLQGGKGVAASSLAFFLYMPLGGLIANVLGMLAVFATQYLSVGAMVIPAAFTLACLIAGDTEAAGIGVFYTVIALSRNLNHLILIPSGQCERVDVLGAIRNKLKRH